MATCNGAATLPKVLDAYCRLVVPEGGWSLLIADDGSTDGTPELIASFAARLPLRFFSQPRRGKNAALNAAIELALSEPRSELFVFTDDDAAPALDWLVRLSRCAREHPAHALFGGSIVPDWGQPPPEWVLRVVPLGLTFGVTSAAEGPVFPGLVWGANMAVRRAVFEAGHRFDSTLGPSAGAYAMGSETEFNRRLGAAGYQAWFCTGATVAHFIRPHQLKARSILQRAYRFGRGARIQEVPDQAARLFGVPRWMFARIGLELAGALRALAARDADALFRRRWELNYLGGFIAQAWRGRRAPPRPRRRVLITSCSGELGGMELRMAQEARLLAGAGWHSTFATPHFRGFDGLAAGLRAGGVHVSLFDPPQFFEQWAWRRTNKLRAQWLSAWRLRRYRPDLVHVAFCWTSYGASVLWLAHHCRLPAVISVHNAFPPAAFGPWHQRLYAQAFSSVRGVYAVSASALQHFMANFGPYLPPSARLCVIPNSVDPARFIPSPARRASARERLGLPHDSLVLGSVARLSPQKRPEALIELFQALRQRFEQLHLVLVGSGPLEQALRARVQALGLTPFVVFAGHVAAVEELLPAFDLHLLLSRSEGFGIATIEAMACGVPVVGTDVPGTADILRASRGGLLVPLHDSAAAAASVAALLSDAPRRQDMARHARAEIEAGYTVAGMEQQVHAFYAGLLP
jgi:glycosyltransferase involved in cell wall biosynthesis